MSHTAPVAIPGSHPASTSTSAGAPALAPLGPPLDKVTSPPIDPSKLNNAPAPLPEPSPSDSSGSNTARRASNNSPPLRSPETGLPVSNAAGESAASDSAYLDTGVPVEPASHPTIAETGELAKSPESGPGPRSGQLQRAHVEPGRRVIRLGSFGGEGLIARPAPPPPGDEADLVEEAVV
ncbi:hypothetical protein EHS25_006247 [Saitozyma podzolica]|uniref:Uncharacterized protein n=1 Tax=Saitozyma podzolica TaxID=1890683 RepID=A0A427YR97_9TREE|nr:hypothetical protein EHS25_006247 [Saitozyma podzolica]